MTDTDHTYDLTLLTNRSALDESLFHYLKQAAGGIVININANNNEFMF